MPYISLILRVFSNKCQSQRQGFTAFLHNTMLASNLEPLTMLRLQDAPLGSIIKTFRCCCEKDCFLILSEKWHNSISPFQFAQNMEKECLVCYILQKEERASEVPLSVCICMISLSNLKRAHNMRFLSCISQTLIYLLINCNRGSALSKLNQKDVLFLCPFS